MGFSGLCFKRWPPQTRGSYKGTSCNRAGMGFPFQGDVIDNCTALELRIDSSAARWYYRIILPEIITNDKVWTTHPLNRALLDPLPPIRILPWPHLTPPSPSTLSTRSEEHT